MNEPLYREELLDHYRHPRNYGKLAEAQASAEVDNPSCGDKIALQIQIKEGRVTGIAFEGKGCVISQASASLMTQHLMSRSLEEIRSFNQEKMLALLKISLGPTRMRCALLSLETLHKAIERFLQGNYHA